MKRRLIVAISLLLLTVGCTPVEQNARDAAAALNGAIAAAQAQYQSSCQSSPTQQVCKLINQGVDAQNALITATETYCGWAVVAPPPTGTKCTPVKSAQGALVTATANANLLVLEIGAAIKGGK